MTAQLNIALVGAGLIGQRHVAYIREVAHLAAIVDPSEQGEAFAKQQNVPWFCDLDALFKALKPDGIIHATPNALHVPLALACVEKNVPCLIEKPIAGEAQEAQRLVEAASQKQVPLLIGHHRRHNSLITAAKAAIDAGRLGDIVAVQAQFWLFKPSDYFEMDWRTKTGAGPTFINLIHDLDLLRHFCGEVVEVQAMESHQQRGFEVEDSSVVLLRFASGALGTVTISDTIVAPWSWEFSAGENPVYDQTPTHAYALGGTRGSMTVPDLNLWTHNGPRSWWSPIGAKALNYEANDPLRAQMAHFLEVIQGKVQPLVSGEEGLRTLLLLEAIKRAASTGEKQTL